MAQPANQEIYDETYGTPLGVSETKVSSPPTPMPINPVERERRAREGSRDLTDRTAVLLHHTQQSAGRLYLRARSYATNEYSRVSANTREATRQARSVARYVRHKHPVALLGVVAGAAFLTGVALRIWRSQS